MLIEVVQEEITSCNRPRGKALTFDGYGSYVYVSWRSRSRSLAGAFAQTSLDVSLSEGSFSQRVRAEIVTGDYFTVLGVAPVLGRLLNKQDEWATQDVLPVVLNYD